MTRPARDDILLYVFKDRRWAQAANPAENAAINPVFMLFSPALNAKTAFFMPCAEKARFQLICGGEKEMPNAKVLSEKQAIVAELTEKLQNAAAGVLVDYKGITVAEDTALRAEMRKNGVEYAVVKNTLTRFAVKNAGLEEPLPIGAL